MNPRKTADLPFHSVIVGMGPVGLATAFELAKKGHRVLILENRSEETAAIRPQVVVLDPVRKHQLLTMIGKSNDNLDEDDIKFVDALATSSEVKLSSVQKFILNRINNLRDNPVQRRYETRIKTLDLAQGEAVTTEEDSIQFTHLIAADGAASATLKLVNDQLPKEQQIRKSTTGDMEHIQDTYHLGAYVKISRKDGGDLKLPKREFVSSFLEHAKSKLSKSHQLYFLRFDKKSHVNSGNKSVKLGFIGEIPESEYKKYGDKITDLRKELQKINEEKNPDIKIQLENEKSILQNHIEELVVQQKIFALEYAKNAAAKYLNIPPEELEIEITASKKTPAKDNLKILSFKGDSQKADKAAITVGTKGFYLVGDAYFTPNYAVGHGLNDGLEAASKLGELKDSSVNSNLNSEYVNSNFNSEYNDLTTGNARHARILMQGIRWLRKMGYGRRLVANLLEREVDINEQENKINLKNNLRPTRMANGNDIIERFISDKFTSLVMALDGPPEKITESVNNIDKVLANTTIEKQYRIYITTQLNQIKKELAKRQPPLSEPANKAFEDLYAETKARLEKYNDELIEIPKEKINKMNAAGHTPLYTALQYGDLDTIRKILEKGANPNKAVKDGHVFTHRVLEDPYIARELLKHGANPFKANLESSTTHTKTSAFYDSKNQKSFPVFTIECLIACYRDDQKYTLARAGKQPLKNALLNAMFLCEDDYIKNVLKTLVPSADSSASIERIEQLQPVDAMRIIKEFITLSFESIDNGKKLLALNDQFIVNALQKVVESDASKLGLHHANPEMPSLNVASNRQPNSSGPKTSSTTAILGRVMHGSTDKALETLQHRTSSVKETSANENFNQQIESEKRANDFLPEKAQAESLAKEDLLGESLNNRSFKS